MVDRIFIQLAAAIDGNFPLRQKIVRQPVHFARRRRVFRHHIKRDRFPGAEADIAVDQEKGVDAGA